MDYAHSTEAALIAADLIPKYHEHLRLVRIEYVFAQGALKSKGKELLGRAKKKSGLDAFLAMQESQDEAQPFFVIEISKPAWDLLDKKQKRALVGHELCHCLWDVDKGIYMRTHDVEEFSEIIKRHGLWQPDVELFATIAAKHVKQMELPLPEESQAETAKASGNGKDKTPTINIYTDRKCTKCGKMESTDSGLCLKCVTARMEKKFKQEVAARRGSARATK